MLFLTLYPSVVNRNDVNIEEIKEPTYNKNRISVDNWEILTTKYTQEQLETATKIVDGNRVWVDKIPEKSPKKFPEEQFNPYSKEEVKAKIRQIAEEKGYQDIDFLLALAKCESNFYPYATNSVGNSPAGSVDRGIWQYNSYWQSNVSDECAFSVRCSTELTIDKLKMGQASLWVCTSKIR